MKKAGTCGVHILVKSWTSIFHCTEESSSMPGFAFVVIPHLDAPKIINFVNDDAFLFV